MEFRLSAHSFESLWYQRPWPRLWNPSGPWAGVKETSTLQEIRRGCSFLLSRTWWLLLSGSILRILFHLLNVKLLLIEQFEIWPAWWASWAPASHKFRFTRSWSIRMCWPNARLCPFLRIGKKSSRPSAPTRYLHHHLRNRHTHSTEIGFLRVFLA